MLAPVQTRADWADRIGRCWDAAQAAVFDVGQCLIDAKAALPHGEFEAMIKADLPFASSTARKFMAIARDDRLRDLKRSPGNVLPGEWTTLYAISRLDDEVLETAIETGEICPDMTRAAVKRIEVGGFEAPPAIEDGCTVEDLRALIAAGRTFGGISADPAWPYQTWSAKGKGKAPDRHYATKDLEAIKVLPVAELAADDCVLALWVVGWIRPSDLEAVGQAWGFEYKARGFEWLKQTAGTAEDLEDDELEAEDLNFGMGQWTRQQTESVWIFTRGKPKRISRSERQVLTAPLGRHSEKPAEFYERFRRLVAGPYLALYERDPRPGFTVWGNEIRRGEMDPEGGSNEDRGDPGRLDQTRSQV